MSVWDCFDSFPSIGFQEFEGTNFRVFQHRNVESTNRNASHAALEFLAGGTAADEFEQVDYNVTYGKPTLMAAAHRPSNFLMGSFPSISIAFAEAKRLATLFTTQIYHWDAGGPVQ